MLLIHSKHFPRGSFHALNLFGLLFVNTRHGRLTEPELRHELIHSLQQREMLYVGFLIWYVAEWLVRLAQCREAYAEMYNKTYLHERRPFAWMKFVK